MKKDSWSIKEHIVHCLDVDIANFHRYRKAIAEPESNIISFSRVWTSRLNYQSADLKLTIKLMKLIRKYMVNHLKTIISEKLEKLCIHS